VGNLKFLCSLRRSKVVIIFLFRYRKLTLFNCNIKGNVNMRASAEEENLLWQFDDDHLLELGTYSCLPLSLKSSGMALEISPEYLDYSHCACVKDFYGVPPNNCTTCPTNCLCPGGQSVMWPRGYYPVFSGKEILYFPNLDSYCFFFFFFDPFRAQFVWDGTSL